MNTKLVISAFSLSVVLGAAGSVRAQALDPDADYAAQLGRIEDMLRGRHAIPEPQGQLADPTVVSDTMLTGSAWQQRVALLAKPSVAKVMVMGGSGSGFIISTDGVLVTNAHVVEDSMGMVQLVFANGVTVWGTVLASGNKSKMDIAFIGLPANPKGWTAMTLRTTQTLQQGTPVVAVGYPLGIGYSLSSGLISGKDRKLPGNSYITFFQTDAAVNPGNSGGPLVAQDMSVVGMNSMGLSTDGTEGSIGLNMAILSDDILRAWTLYKKTGALTPAWLGVRLSPHQAGQLIVKQIYPGPSEKAGIKLDDVIVKIDGKAHKTTDSFLRAIHYAIPGETMKLTVLRDGQELELALVLEAERAVPRSVIGNVIGEPAVPPRAD